MQRAALAASRPPFARPRILDMGRPASAVFSARADGAATNRARGPGIAVLVGVPRGAGRAQINQATFLKALETLSLIGSTVSVVTFWASAVSSLLWEVMVSNCLRICGSKPRAISASDFTANSWVCKIERRVGVGARHLDHLEPVVGGALAGGA